MGAKLRMRFPALPPIVALVALSGCVGFPHDDDAVDDDVADDDAGDDDAADDDSGDDDAADDDSTTPEVEVREDGFYRDGERFVPLVAYELPAGASDADALAAGFDVLAGPGADGLRVIPLLASGDDLAAYVDPYLDDGNLLGWVGPDEALWNGLSAADVESEYVAPLRAVDPERALLLNHAPRGSAGQPLAFDLLEPYLALSQVALMDIYPVPEGNGHSALVEHPGLDAVGAHTDILVDLVAGSGHPQPVVMVLLGAGLGRIPTERWEILETWVADTGVSAATVRSAVACDLDADGADEAVVAADEGLLVYDFGRSPFGERVQTVAWPNDLEVAGLRHLLCADTHGTGFAELLLLVDGGPTRQDLWVAITSPNGVATPLLNFRAEEPALVLDVMRHAVAGDYDGDGCDDVAMSYDYPDDSQAVFVVRSQCSGLPIPADQDTESWLLTTTAVLDLEAWPHAVAGDLDGDGRDDLLFAGGDGTHSWLLELRSSGKAFEAPVVVQQLDAATLDLSGGRLALGELDGSAGPELIAARGSALVGLGVGPGSPPSFSAPEPWYGAGGFAEGDLLALAGGGDADGDGRGDLLLAEAAPGGELRLRLAISTGSYFGARDPLAEEMRFMGLDALVHGAVGLVYWGQQFASSGDAVWDRLRDVAGELAALQPCLAGSSLQRTLEAGHAAWWVEGADGLCLVEQNESREREQAAIDRPLPVGYTGSVVQRWDPVALAFVPEAGVVLAGDALQDATPLGPYETRIYLVEP